MDDDLNRPNDRAGLARLAQPLVADPPVATAPLGEIRRRAARRARQRAAALAVIVVAVLAVGGTALARSGREGPAVQVGTTPGTGQATADLRIYLTPTVTPAQIAAIQAALAGRSRRRDADLQQHLGRLRPVPVLLRRPARPARVGDPGRAPRRVLRRHRGRPGRDGPAVRPPPCTPPGSRSSPPGPPYTTPETGPSISIPAGAVGRHHGRARNPGDARDAVTQVTPPDRHDRSGSGRRRPPGRSRWTDDTQMAKRPQGGLPTEGPRDQRSAMSLKASPKVTPTLAPARRIRSKTRSRKAWSCSPLSASSMAIVVTNWLRCSSRAAILVASNPVTSSTWSGSSASNSSSARGGGGPRPGRGRRTGRGRPRRRRR